MIDYDADINFALEDAGEAVTIDGTPCNALIDAVDTTVLDDRGPGIVGKQLQATVRTAAVASLKEHSTIVRAGTTYYAEQVERSADGRITTFFLSDS